MMTKIGKNGVKLLFLKVLVVTFFSNLNFAESYGKFFKQFGSKYDILLNFFKHAWFYIPKYR